MTIGNLSSDPGVTRVADVAARLALPTPFIGLVYQIDTDTLYAWSTVSSSWIVLSGGSGGYPTVANFAALPAAADHTGSIYIVLASTGIPFVTWKKKGFYYSDGANWVVVEDISAIETLTTDSLTVGTLSGVLKATAGVVSGSATTADLPDSTDKRYITDLQQESLGKYYHGVVVLPTLSNSSGSLVIGSDGTINFARNSTGDGGYVQFVNITGTTLALTDKALNFVYADYNSGSPIYTVALSSASYLTDARLSPVCRVYREGTVLCVATYDEYGIRLGEKSLYKDITLNGFERQSGLVLSTAATRISTISSGSAWFGVQLFSLDANVASTDTLCEFYLVAGVWTKAIVTSYDSSYYSDGTDRQALGSNKYVAKYFFRSIGVENQASYIHGNQYNSASLALSESIPAIPPAISSTSLYVGKIVIRQGATNGTAYPRSWEGAITSSGAVNHNDLANRDEAGSHLSFTPLSDSTSAFQFFKADGTTDFITLDTTNEILKHAGGTQDYDFGHRGAAFYVEGKSAGTGAQFDLFTNDGDGTDSAAMVVWGIGNRASTANQEKVSFGYSSTNTNFYIGTSSGGTGSVRPLVLYTGLNTNQLYLGTSGDVGIGTTPSVTLDVAGQSKFLVASSVLTDGGSSFINCETYSNTGTHKPTFIGIRGRGTLASPLAVNSDDSLFALQSNAYYNTTSKFTGALIGMYASENWSATNRGTYITFEGTPTTTATRAEWMRIINGNVGIGIASPVATLGGLDIASGGLSLTLGANQTTQSTRTDATAKYCRIGVVHYTNAEEPVCLISAGSGVTTGTKNFVHIGGGTSLMNAVNEFRVYTTDAIDTTTGTLRMEINGTGDRIYETRVIKKTFYKSGIEDNTATTIFTITTPATATLTDGAGSYSCYIRGLVTYPLSGSPQTNKPYHCIFSRSNANASGNPGTSSSVQVLLDGEAVTTGAARSIDGVTISLVEIDEQNLAVQATIDLTVASSTTSYLFGEIEIIWSGYSTYPTITI